MFGAITQNLENIVSITQNFEINMVLYGQKKGVVRTKKGVVRTSEFFAISINTYIVNLHLMLWGDLYLY